MEIVPKNKLVFNFHARPLFPLYLLKAERKRYEKETEKYYSSLEKLLNMSAKKKEPQLQEVFILAWTFLRIHIMRNSNSKWQQNRWGEKDSVLLENCPFLIIFFLKFLSLVSWGRALLCRSVRLFPLTCLAAKLFAGLFAEHHLCCLTKVKPGCCALVLGLKPRYSDVIVSICGECISLMVLNSPPVSPLWCMHQPEGTPETADFVTAGCSVFCGSVVPTLPPVRRLNKKTLLKSCATSTQHLLLMISMNSSMLRYVDDDDEKQYVTFYSFYSFSGKYSEHSEHGADKCISQ